MGSFGRVGQRYIFQVGSKILQSFNIEGKVQRTLNLITHCVAEKSIVLNVR